MFFSKTVLVLLAVALLAPIARALDLDSNWQLLTGADPLERTAAEVFRDEAVTRFNITLPPPVPSTSADTARPALIIGTIADNPLIAAEHARAPFRIDATASPESFHVRLHGNTLYAVGATAKGAMNAAFRILDRNHANVDNLDFTGTPNFRWRVGNNEMNQTPPPGWTHDDQARYYARHYINVVWGEKKRPPIPFATRAKYGIGLLAEIRFPQGDADARAWFNDPDNRDAIYNIDPAKKRKNLWSDPKGLKLISPFAPAGRQWYLDTYKKLLRENPDIKIIYNMFSDYNVLPETTDSHNAFTKEPYAHSTEDTIIEILKTAREAALSLDPKSEIVPHAWLWQSFWFQRKRELAFMTRLQTEGFGLMYNEAGDSDDWIFRLNNFDNVALKTTPDSRSAHGDNYLSIVSAGGACESVNPVIGMPLPRIAAHKLALLSKAGAHDFVLWWGSCEGWTYQPNLEAIAELVWADPDTLAQCTAKDFDSAAPLLARLAERDFGQTLAPDILAYYRAFDAALVTTLPLYKKPSTDAQGDPAQNGLHIYNWYQRLGTYTKPHPFKGVFLEPVTLAAFADVKRFQQSVGWGANIYALKNYEATLARLRDAQKTLALALEKNPALNSAALERLQKMQAWTQLVVFLWESQYHHMKGFALVQALKGAQKPEAEIRRALAPVTRESIRNTEALLALLPRFAPNMNLTWSHSVVVEGKADPQKGRDALRAKLAAMKKELGEIQ